MPAAFTIRVLDSIIRIEFDESLGAADASALRKPWAALEVPGRADATIRVAIGYANPGPKDVIMVRAGALDRAAESLTTAVTLEGIKRLRGRALLLHAAAIALDDGSVIGFIGPSGRGKTTASRALAQDAGYVTDETLAILPDLTVIPYPKPLSVLEGPPPKQSIAPASLGMRPLPHVPLKLVALVLLDRRKNVEHAYVEKVELTEAVGLIAPETSALVAMPRPLRDLVDVIQRTGGVRRVVYSEAAGLPALLPHVIGLATPPRTDIEDAVPSRADPSPRGNTHRRAPFHDAVRIGERLAIHDGRRVVVLDGLGPALWESADGMTPTPEIAARVSRLIPPPPGVDATTEIERQLDALTEAGLLLRG